MQKAASSFEAHDSSAAPAAAGYAGYFCDNLIDEL
jgi:hypothetical protein